MRQRIALLIVLVLLVTSFIGPLGGSSESATGRAMFSTLDHFADNSTFFQRDFYESGNDSSVSISVPAAAIIRMATVNISGQILENDDLFINDTTSDFRGDFNNISVQNGSLMLKPLLNQTAYNTSNAPVSIAAGDVNYDGHTDIVVANSNDGTVGVLIQNWSLSKFEPQVTYGVEQNPRSVAVGDLNYDGRQDVAVACAGWGTLNVLLQKQDGTLGTAVSYASGGGTRGVAIGEFNRDGRRDVVTVNPTDSTLSLFLQNSTGIFARYGVFNTGTNPVSVAAGDINLDGRDEAVVANKDASTISVFVQNATTGLKLSTIYNVGSGPVNVAIGDVNRDGRKDVVVAQQGAGTVGVLLQTSGGLLGQRVDYPSAGAPSSVTTGDLNFDGRADVAASSGAGNISVFWQRGDGTLSQSDDYKAGTQPASVAIADLQSDGKNDLAVANSGDNTVSILPLRPTPPGSLAPMVTYGIGGSPVGLRGGDLNADGLDDLAAADTLTGNNGLSVLLQTKAGNMAPQVQYSTGTVSQALKSVAICDLNRDGRMDVVASNVDAPGLTIFYQTGSGDFSGTPVTYLTNISSSAGYQVSTGDLNSDGWPDIVLSNVMPSTSFPETNITSIFIQNPTNNAFNHTVDLLVNSTRAVIVGDLNSDGRDDLAITSYYANLLTVYLQNPNGTLNTTPAQYPTDINPHGARIADLNADGRNDVAVCGWYSNCVDVYIQDSAGMLNPKMVYSAPNNEIELEIVDYDSDGLNDIAAAGYLGANTVTIFNQTREGKFSAARTLISGTQPTNVARGDFNGDGKTDIAVTNRGVNNVGIFTQNFSVDMNGTFTSSFKQLPHNVVEATAFWNCTTTSAGQNVSVWLTHDRGKTWTPVAPGEPVQFFTSGNTLGYRVRMNSTALNLTPYLDNITVHYKMRSYPIDPSLDIGATGTPAWSWTGPFGMSQKPTRIDFTSILNDTMQSQAPGPDGNIRIPFVINCGSLGTLILQNLSVQYDLAPSAPELKSLTDNEFLNIGEPTFQMVARDNDTDRLMFRIELSQNNFSTVKKSIDQLTSPDGWDKESYKRGEVATFQLPHDDRLTTDGSYQWRAYVWDDTVWSGPSKMGQFRLDTKAPKAKVAPLPAYTNTTEFMVSWNGSDPEPGSGLDPDATYDVLYKDRDNAPWTIWLEMTNVTSAAFTGEQGKTYYFQAIARDRATNAGQTVPGNGDTRTILDTTPPGGTVTDDGVFTGDNTRLHAVFKISDPESGVVRYEYWISNTTGEGGTYTYGPALTDKKDVTIPGLFLTNGSRHFFSVKAQNAAGIWSPLISSDGITIKMKAPVASIAYWNGTQASSDIQIQLSATDPNAAGIADGDIEYRVANVKNRATVDWSDWMEIGGSDWGDAKPGPEPFVFGGEPGKAYRFRYKVQDIVLTYSDFSDPGNITRINRPPVPVISAPVTGKTGLAMEFFANDTSDPDGDKLAYSWDLGDGTWEYGKAVTHTYSQGKTYTVTLYVDDSVENVSAQMTTRIHAPASNTVTVSSGAPLLIMAAVAVAVGCAGALALIVMRRKKPANAPAKMVRQEPKPGEEAKQMLDSAVERLADYQEAHPEAALDVAPVMEQMDIARGFLESEEYDDALAFAMEVDTTVTKMTQPAAPKVVAINKKKALAAEKKITVEAQQEQGPGEEARMMLDFAVERLADYQEGHPDDALDVAPVMEQMDIARGFLKSGEYDDALAFAIEVDAAVNKMTQPAAPKREVVLAKKVVAVKKKKVAVAIKACPGCGEELAPEWSACPACGMGVKDGKE